MLTTCAAWPDLSTSDAVLLDELTRRGHTVSVRPWNAAPIEDFGHADLVVLRSNWDFHHHMAAFDAWLTEVSDRGAVLRNPAALVRAFSDKSYLLRLGALGVRIPATLVMDAFDADRVRRWMTRRGLDRAVCKPAWGASGHDVEVVDRGSLEAAKRRWNEGEDRRSVVVQEFVPEVIAGEHALVYFGGDFSHALHRVPAADDFRVNGRYGGTTHLAADVDPAAIAAGAAIVHLLPVASTYARIDLVVTDVGVTLMEVEVNEPALGLDLAPGSAARFADALLDTVSLPSPIC